MEKSKIRKIRHRRQKRGEEEYTQAHKPKRVLVAN